MESESNGPTPYQITKTKVSIESFHAFKKGKRFIVNQGGTRSGKTYSLIQLLIGLALRNKVHISVISHAYPHLRKGAIKDFKTIMEKSGLYEDNSYSITNSTYSFPSGSIMEFFSADQSSKVRGPGRDIMFVNEANLINQDTFRQLNVRTRDSVFLDYNPADEFHWIYDEILPRKETAFIQTTYKDNPYLSKQQANQIELLKDIDPDFWRVYGLGERGANSHTIYPKFEMYDRDNPYLDYCYGLDFGFNHPNALVKVSYDDGRLYFKQELYKSHLSTPELIEQVKSVVGSKYVYCDSARPEIIHDLVNAGVNAYPTKKFEGSVKDGIDYIRSNRIFVHKESLELQKEMRTYKWKQKPNGEMVDEPIKAYDDLLDAARYGAISFKMTSPGPMLTFHR